MSAENIESRMPNTALEREHAIGREVIFPRKVNWKSWVDGQADGERQLNVK